MNETTNKELWVPTEALAMEGIEPSPGEPVSVQVEGELVRSENGLSYISPKSANGLPIPEQKGDAARPKTPEEEEAELMRQAEAMDGMEDYR